MSLIKLSDNQWLDWQEVAAVYLDEDEFFGDMYCIALKGGHKLQIENRSDQGFGLVTDLLEGIE